MAQQTIIYMVKIGNHGILKNRFNVYFKISTNFFYILYVYIKYYIFIYKYNYRV